MIELQDGRLLAVAEALGGIAVTYSSNKGETWSSPRLIASPPEKVFYAVPDVIQLSDGTILVGINPRPVAPYSTERRFGIRVVQSTDNGESWSEPIFVFDAQHTFNDGCWEPAFLELPSGEVQCYFANENEYTGNDDQNISMCRSFDKGKTWSDPVTICYRPGSRDGMPVPLLLKDESEIAVIIEDNGWPGRGNFAATTVRNTLQDNWTKGYIGAVSPFRKMIFETIPPVGIVSAAPYIRKLPWGETVASYQSNENRNSLDLQHFDMQVLVGDERAQNFKAKSAPFSLGSDKHSIWNSVSVIDTGIVVALGSIGVPNGRNDVVMIKGTPIRQARAGYGSITVDGVKKADEAWTTPNVAQLNMGHISKNKTTVDFLYDDKYLYLTSRVIDRNIINTGIDNDGIRFMIDVDDFKQVNDRYGHVKGDICLAEIAACIKKAYARHGYCYRMGGDEFCVLLRDGDREHACARDFVRRLDERRKELDFLPTVSFGSAEISSENVVTVKNRADHNMYRHKKEHKAHRMSGDAGEE